MPHPSSKICEGDYCYFALIVLYSYNDTEAVEALYLSNTSLSCDAGVVLASADRPVGFQCMFVLLLL